MHHAGSRDPHLSAPRSCGPGRTHSGGRANLVQIGPDFRYSQRCDGRARPVNIINDPINEARVNELQLSRQDLLEHVIGIAHEAGRAVMDVYGTGFSVRGKADASPVTEADTQAEAIIIAGLRSLTPDLPIVAEESMAAGHIPRAGATFWLVDPLDGTKEFIGRNGEFTVNIALVDRGVPVLGVVFAPALGRLFAGAIDLGAFVDDAAGRRAIHCRVVPDDGLTVVASRSHGDAATLDAFLEGRKVASLVNAGSSLKLCLVAAGEADLYPRFGRTMEWDIAAGHAVLLAAGGSVRDISGTPLRYGKDGFDNPHFVASGDVEPKVAMVQATI
jgi:3'(2'), 5'-bisphosphate nucleotidase